MPRSQPLRQVHLLYISVIAYCVPCSQLLRQLPLLYILLTTYSVPSSQLPRQLAILYISLTAYHLPPSQLPRPLPLLYISITAYPATYITSCLILKLTVCHIATLLQSILNVAGWTAVTPLFILWTSCFTRSFGSKANIDVTNPMEGFPWTVNNARKQLAWQTFSSRSCKLGCERSSWTTTRFVWDLWRGVVGGMA